MITGLLRRSLRLLASGLVSVGVLHAADYYVGVNGSGFSPTTQTIAVGDTVIWVNNDDLFPHTSTSDLATQNPGYWNGLMVSQEDTFSWTFNSAGTFTYHDVVDVGTGTIIVALASVTPSITLESVRIVNSQFLFEATGLTFGKATVLLASTNLMSWTAIQTNIATGSSLTFTNATSSGARFFQVVEQP